jgi:hypothetical protein
MSKFVDIVSVSSLGCNCCGEENPLHLSVESAVLVCNQQCFDDYKAVGEAMFEDETTRIQVMEVGSGDQSVILITSPEIGILGGRGTSEGRKDARNRAKERRERRHAADLARRDAKTSKA